MKIGEYLLEQNLLTESQINNVLWLQSQQNFNSSSNKKRFAQWCIDLMFLTETQVYQALSVCWGYEFESDISNISNNNNTNNIFYHHELQELEQQQQLKKIRQFQLQEHHEKILKVVTPSTFNLISDKKTITQNITEDLFNFLVETAIQENASDVHLEPFADFVFYRMRIDGVLTPCEKQSYFSMMQHQTLVSRIKALAKLDIAQNRLAQDGRISWRNCDIRVAIHPTQFGEKIVLRFFYPQQYRQLHQLNLSAEITEKLKHIIHQPQGLILFTGPTGSGKTSLMYSLLGELNRLEQNIMTIEEPVEYRLPYLQQTDLSENSQMTWESSLKSLLRQDPDTIVLGELRDEKTAKLALQSCLTGHRIWATVHSNSAIATFARFSEWGIEPIRLTAGVTAVIQQRLIKKKSGKGRELILEILDNSSQQLTEHLTQGKHWFSFKPFLTLQEHAQNRLSNNEISQEEIHRVLGV